MGVGPPLNYETLSDDRKRQVRREYVVSLFVIAFGVLLLPFTLMGVYTQVWGDADLGGPCVAMVAAVDVLCFAVGPRKLMRLRADRGR